MGVFQYFSYGSNLLRERILISNPTAKFRCVGRLNNYALQFDTPRFPGKPRWHGAPATIEEKDGSYVMGCVWEINEAHTSNLDAQEALYHPIFVDVDLETGENVKCRSYQMNNDRTGDTLPSPFYIKVMIDGAKQNNMPAEYINFLENVPTNGIKEPPPVYLTVMDMIEKFRKSAKENGTTF
ncbi:gamma-glutamylcyclotransferase [Aplysia californica]|uniref:gamma-glutamylcyclotransferase n=1 Tax=Aplysia californica TaxID=6500 RepID=A0ABM0JUG6_APLCA|nr:gamma-glutamylcyclotransferase [Aplysia californica]